ncbi:DNA polymerase/3'-5' exonuclease PolX [Bradyrhizobium sp. GCM10027634]|uniref:DNA polymerase/3'-5' exonuclease PolX n=1 Tax=unclassified Bradyrhizobium TaxID=2631580 RepID=UPI00263BDBB2|nr:DNA polymerase/3'-5' exonuclease PolX [Bradyrhizobium sp. WYCCWR 12677]MDN5001245.1 DNA polymerase/3'-5' exonuclease PolX [Bradyrhizobium sp. WYCCWR 12677]
MPVQNAEIAEMFDQTAELLEIKGDNPFRSRAYRNAARLIERLPKSITSLLKAGEDLSELPGIGKDLAGKIATIVATHKFDVLDRLKRELPGDLGEIAALPGLGPKRVKLLYDKLGVRSLEDLRRAIRSGRLRELKGFGTKSEQKLAAALAKPQAEKRFKLSEAEAEAEALLNYLGGTDRDQMAVAGSYRRRRETVGDLDIVVAAHNGAAVGDKLTRYEDVANVLAHGPTRTTVVLRSGLQVDLRVVPKASYGAALLYFTGSKAHNIALRGLANDHGWKLNEYGLFEGRQYIVGTTEEEIYRKLGLATIPPEMREDRGEITLARTGKLPRLITLGDIRGDLHVHSNWSDGTAPIVDMAAAAKARGYDYIAITDHSQHVAVAHGLDAARLSRQIDEIDRLNEKLHGFTVLKGAEVDILADGRLDLPDKILSRLDMVVAAVHYKFDLSRQLQTDRILRAMDNGHVSIIAHPTGRLISEREPYEVDIEAIVVAAADRSCCLELNADPDRLDLTDIHAQAAKSAGVKLVISTDAHAVAGFDNMRFGIDQARRGWLAPSDVINTQPLSRLRELLKR